jgi:hypothetical protein
MENVSKNNTDKGNELKGTRQINRALTAAHTNCRLCNYAGFSNMCNFFRDFMCPPLEEKKALRNST